MQIVEAVEKVLKQILGRDAERSDLIEWATINDFMIGRVKASQKASFSLFERTFPIGSLDEYPWKEGPDKSNLLLVDFVKICSG